MLSLADSDDPFTELERRQDAVLRQLDDLDRRVEQAIRDFAPAPKDTAQQGAAERFGRKQFRKAA